MNAHRVLETLWGSIQQISPVFSREMFNGVLIFNVTYLKCYCPIKRRYCAAPNMMTWGVTSSTLLAKAKLYTAFCG